MLSCSATGADSRELYGTGALNRELYMVMGYRGSLSGVFLVTGYRACSAGLSGLTSKIFKIAQALYPRTRPQ